MYHSLRDFSLAEWLNYLETSHPIEIQLGLSRVQEAARRLNLLTPSCKVITVAGTNGKGSTVAALESIYIAAGYQTGSYTSPHLLQFNERVKVNAVMASDEDLCSAFLAVEEARRHTPLTYFEVVTLAALWHFKKYNLDIIILEVGLGGRQDATNIIDADLAIITTIDFDHQQYLGNTLEEIGYEKAGILRAGREFIYADHHPPISVMNEAKKLGCRLYRLGHDYDIGGRTENWFLCMKEKQMHLPRPKIQLKAAASAIMASNLLQAFLPVTDQHIGAAMPMINIPGRLEFIPGKIDIIYDVSHNPQAACLLAEYIKKLDNKKRVHAVFSALNDKDLNGLIRPLKNVIHYWYPAQIKLKRAASRQAILLAFEELDIFVEAFYADPLNAFFSAKERAEDGDLVVVYGSFYTVSQIRDALQSNSVEQEEII